MIGGSVVPDATSAEDLTARYAAAYRVAYRLLGDAAVADVLARDALVHAGAGSGRLFRRSDDARACLHAAVLALRDELWLGRPRSLPGGTGFGEVRHRDERRRLRMAVRSLLGRQRMAFVLEQLAGWSPAAAAAELRMSPQAYRRVADRAQQIVRSRCEIQMLGDGAEAA
jgi:DNA-directed RNA polymerase specialized sigma24 family protein